MARDSVEAVQNGWKLRKFRQVLECARPLALWPHSRGCSRPKLISRCTGKREGELSKTSRPLRLAQAIIAVVLIAGCKTGEPTSASFASVVIPGKTPEQISQTAGAVFQADGYSIGSLNPDSMMFQKEASRGASLAYGGVVDTYYGSTTVVRVRAQVVDLGSGTHRLQCKAYMVRRAEDAFFEDESPLLNIRSGPYQKLLNEVAKRLK